jgi:hypothetical protein
VETKINITDADLLQQVIAQRNKLQDDLAQAQAALAAAMAHIQLFERALATPGAVSPPTQS